jgi:hypothetical protein
VCPAEEVANSTCWEVVFDFVLGEGSIAKSVSKARCASEDVLGALKREEERRVDIQREERVESVL